MTLRRRALALLLLAGALGLAALGQHYFFNRRDFLWDGLVFHVLAMVCLLLAWRLTTVQPQAPRSFRFKFPSLGTWIHDQPVSTGLMSLGLFFCLGATWLSRRPMWQRTIDTAFLLWLLGIGAALAAAFWPSEFPPQLKTNWKSRFRGIGREDWLEIATVVGLTGLALVLRVVALESVPFTLGGDEAWHALLARQVLHQELRNPFVMGYMSMPTLFYWPMSWAQWLVGSTVTGARLPAALIGTVTIPIFYLFVRRLWGKRIALLSATFLVAYDYHIHYSRLSANNVWDPLFMLLMLWPLDVGLTAADERTRTRYFMLAGLVMGLSTFFYTGARLLPVLVALYVGFVWIKRRIQKAEFGPVVWPLLMFGLCFLIAAGPILAFAIAQPNEWNARVNQVGIFQSGWLAREPGLTGKNTLQILADQFLRAAGAFHVYPDRTVWYGAERPLLGFLSGALAILGMAWAIFHWKERRYFLILIWFWSVIISGGMLTESPPSSQRLVMVIPAVAVLVAVGLEKTVVLLRRLLGFRRVPWENVALGLLVLILAVTSVHYYFVKVMPTRRYGSQNGETTTMMGHYLRDLEGEYQAYFFGAPRIYWGFGTMSFLAPHVPGHDVLEPLVAPPTFVDESRGAVFLFLPERGGELSLVQAAYPKGQLREFRDSEGQTRFIAYTVPPWP